MLARRTRLTLSWLALVPVVVACEPPPAVAPNAAATPKPAMASAAPEPTPAPPVVDLEFLKAYAETRRFTRGTPQRATLTPDERAVIFLRSEARSTRQSLYEMDIATGAVREILTPESLDHGPEQLTLEERARRERMRITASGFTGFELSHDGRTLVVSLSGKLYAVDRASGKTRAIDTGKGAVIDPHLSPDGKLVGYVQSDDVHVASVDGAIKAHAITRGGTDDNPHGLADFAAAEELERARGFWWSPDSKSILYEDSDATALEHFTIADPSHPERAADRVTYPRAGTANAVLRVGITGVGAPGRTTWVAWDSAAMPYLANVAWSDGAPPCLIVLDRLQKNEAMLVVDPKTGKTREAVHDHDPAWVNAGGSGTHGAGGMSRTSRWLPDGSAFLWWSERDGDGRLGLVSANDASSVKWLTPRGTQVTALLDLDPKRRVAIVEVTRDALHFEVDSVSLDGDGPLTPVARIDDGAVRGNFGASHTLFLADETSLSGVHRLVARSVDGKTSREVPSVAVEAPLVHVEMEDVGPEHTHVALVRPRGFVEHARYPLLDSAYGGPHAQVVTLDARAMAFTQWMADATGAIVVAIDAKGTPGRGRDWERAIAGKLGDVPIDGHIAVIRELVRLHPEIDGARVGVYGKSFGGYFASLAVLRHPDVYSVGVAVAPVTDWASYDTAYTERYLGLPDANAAAYGASSVLVEAKAHARTTAADSTHPAPTLLIVHGTADDNVYLFNSLQLVDILSKTGQPVRFLPLLGQTHQIASPEAQKALWLAAVETFQQAFAKRP